MIFGKHKARYYRDKVATILEKADKDGVENFFRASEDGSVAEIVFKDTKDLSMLGYYCKDYEVNKAKKEAKHE